MCVFFGSLGLEGKACKYALIKAHKKHTHTHIHTLVEKQFR